MLSPQKYPPPKVIAVDVDGTLLIQGAINQPLVQWCKDQKTAGYGLILWSSRGQAHAERAADQAGITDLFDFIISKPGYVVDDQGWGWTRFTRVIKNLSKYGN